MADGSGGGIVRDDTSEDEENDVELGRAEELRRERLNALVKRNLTAILLEVTDAMFGLCLTSLYRKVLRGWLFIASHAIKNWVQAIVPRCFM